MASSGSITLLVSPATSQAPLDNVQGPFLDIGRQKLLYFSNGSFYWFDPFVTDASKANVLAHGPVDLKSIDTILMVKISLDSQLIAIQKSVTEVVVMSMSSDDLWPLTIKHSEDNRILTPGIVWSEHGGKSQDLVILTGRGLELYKASVLRGQCKLSRAMAQR